MKPNCILIVLFLLVLCASAGASDEQGWKFRSDLSNSGVFDDGGVTPDGTLLWTYSTGHEVRSSPAIVDGVVYFGNKDGNLYALDAYTRDRIWNFTAGLGIQSSPAVVDGIVYAGSWDHNVYAVDADDGSLVWNFTTGDAVISSPAVAHGNVYVGSFDGSLYALDAATGSPAWEYPTAGPRIASSPAIVDSVVYVGSEDGNLYALNALTGSLLWNFTTGGWVGSSPAVADGTVYFGSDDGNVYALNALDGSLIWNYTTGDMVRSSPAVLGGVMYVGSYDGYMYALDASTGALLWSYATGDGVYSSPAVANGIVYVGTLGFKTSFYALDADTGALLWDYSMGEWNVYSGPTVADGIVYVGCDDGNLYAFGATPENPPAYDDFDDNACNETLWNVIESGGPYVTETDQRLEITIPPDSSADADIFYAGIVSRYALRGDFDIQVDYHLLTWPENNGVRMGLWIERPSSTYTVERACYGISDGFAPGDHYTTNFDDSILLSATGDTGGKLRLVRTGSLFEGYYFNETSGDWILSQRFQGDTTSAGEATFVLMAWSHDYAFVDELVVVAFDNFVINKGTVVTPGITPPAAVTGLTNATFQPNLIRWTWNDPDDPDFSHVLVYLNGVFQANVTAGTEAWTTKDLDPSTAYTIGTRTVGNMGAINGTWVNHTATTSSLSIVHLNPSSVYAGSPAFTLNVSGTGYRESCLVLWNSEEQMTQFHDAGHLSIDVSAGMVSHPALVNITVYDSTTGEFSNPVMFSVRDPISGAHAWKFRSDSTNSGVYDDGGTRPGNELLWKYMTEGYRGSSPAVVDGVVYNCGLYDINAIDARTGRLLWSSPDGGGEPSPAVADNVIYVGSSDYNISALDASTGALLWKFRTGHVRSSPALYNGVVYAGSWDNNVYALDAATGALLWKYQTGNIVRSSPAVADGVVYIGSDDGNLYALDAETGNLLWKYATGNLVRSSPSVANGVVYFGSSTGRIYALDAMTGAHLWDYSIPGSGESCPAVADGVVYIGSDDGNLYALDAGTGNLLWKYATGNLVRSSPSVANGVVYFGSSTGRIYALDAGTGDLIWEYTTEEEYFSSAAIAHGVLYVQGYSGYLYALTTLPDDPPESVTDLHAITVNGAEITWAWNDPGTLGFSHIMVYLDGVFKENVTAGTLAWTATGLAPSTSYTIGTRTVGKKGGINANLVTYTTTTGTLTISSLDPATVVEDSDSFTLNVHGTGYTPTCSILWNGEEQVTQYLQADHLNMDVPAEFVAHSRRVNISIHDPVSGESSNSVILPVTDNPATAKARKFRSDLKNTGVYDDGGRRPVPTLLWTYKTGARVTSSPSVADSVVYVGSSDQNVYALEADTGALLWKYNTMEHNDWVSSSPAVSNGVVYIGGLRTKIHALDAYSGDFLWKYKLPIRSTSMSRVSSSAAVADGVIYIGNMDGKVYAFNEETGDLLWRYAILDSEYDEQSIFSSPAVVDGVVYIYTYRGCLYALDASSGALLWDYVPEGEYAAYSSPAVADGVVYVGSSTSSTSHIFHAFNAHTGDLLWEFPTGGSISSSPAIENGIVYFGCNDNSTYALNAGTGNLLWKYATGNLVRSSPAVANGMVYFGSYDNNTYALDASTGALLWTFDVGGEVTSSPAVANGVVYIGSGDGNVYAIGSLPLDPPGADFSASVTSGDAPLDVIFTDTSTGVVTTRFWDFGDGTTVWANETGTVSHTYSFPGTFSVSLTAGNIDAQDTATKTGYIQVNPVGPAPRARFSISPIMGFTPLTIRFTDRSSGTPATWHWDFGDGTTSSEQNPTHIYTTAGRYTPTLTVSNTGGTSTYAFFVRIMQRSVYPTPTVTGSPTIPPKPDRAPIAVFGMNRSFGNAPLSVQFTDRSFNTPTSWHWDFGDGSNATVQNPLHVYMEPGTYPVSLTVTNGIGEGATSRRVYVR